MSKFSFFNIFGKKTTLTNICPNNPSMKLKFQNNPELNDLPINSFQVNHDKIREGIYSSRTDYFGDYEILTIDIRVRIPNSNNYLTTTEAHTIEHFGATYFRKYSELLKNNILYFGPMGCRTGFYLVLIFDTKSKVDEDIGWCDIRDEIINMFRWILDYKGRIPGSKRKECGNFRDLDKKSAKKIAKNFIRLYEEDKLGSLLYYC